MCAIAVGKYFGVTSAAIKVLSKPTTLLMHVLQMIDKMDIINFRCYNANPTSMQHALESFAKSKQRENCTSWDMFELGDETTKEHQFIADLCTQLNFETIVLVGKAFCKQQLHLPILKFADRQYSCQRMVSTAKFQWRNPIIKRLAGDENGVDSILNYIPGGGGILWRIIDGGGDIKSLGVSPTDVFPLAATFLKGIGNCSHKISTQCR